MEYFCDDLKVGDKVWACAFTLNSTRTGFAYSQKPVFGMIRGQKSKSKNDAISKKEAGMGAQYFVPFKKGSTTDLIWYKAIQIGSRRYAASEEECIELFNQLVEENRNWFETQAKCMEACRIEA